MIIVGDRRLEITILRALWLIGRAPDSAPARHGATPTPFAFARRPSAHSRLAILSAKKVSEFLEKCPRRLHFIKERAWIIVVVEDTDAGRLLDAGQVADGIIFTSIEPTRLPTSLNLARLGYCAIPRNVMPLIQRGRLRWNLLPLLTPLEAKTLHLLGLGFTNRGMAIALDLDEPRTKYVIRRLLKKLHLQNRTQAAVFAVRDIFLAASSGNRSGAVDRFLFSNDRSIH